jgi:sedoheptulose-bisphosphatase
MKLICLSTCIAAASAFAPPSISTGSRASATTKLYGEFGASSTSFYTTTEKQDTYASLEEVLEQKCKNEKVRQVIIDMLDVCADITEALRTALVTVEGSMNDFGDAQLSVDVSHCS